MLVNMAQSCAEKQGETRIELLVSEADQMYECIVETLAQRRYFGLYLKVHPDWDPYRDAPRFTALLRRMGLEE